MTYRIHFSSLHIIMWIILYSIILQHPTIEYFPISEYSEICMIMSRNGLEFLWMCHQWLQRPQNCVNLHQNIYVQSTCIRHRIFVQRVPSCVHQAYIRNLLSNFPPKHSLVDSISCKFGGLLIIFFISSLFLFLFFSSINALPYSLYEGLSSSWIPMMILRKQ